MKEHIIDLLLNVQYFAIDEYNRKNTAAKMTHVDDAIVWAQFKADADAALKRAQTAQEGILWLRSLNDEMISQYLTSPSDGAQSTAP